MRERGYVYIYMYVCIHVQGEKGQRERVKESRGRARERARECRGRARGRAKTRLTAQVGSRVPASMRHRVLEKKKVSVPVPVLYSQPSK